jgi:methylenetetrahydrofolate--tRNA-(uracil-5-)-methyltransferase
MFNLVGFQTKLTYSEQERVLRLVPALKKRSFYDMEAFIGTLISTPPQY